MGDLAWLFLSRAPTSTMNNFLLFSNTILVIILTAVITGFISLIVEIAKRNEKLKSRQNKGKEVIFRVTGEELSKYCRKIPQSKQERQQLVEYINHDLKNKREALDRERKVLEKWAWPLLWLGIGMGVCLALILGYYLWGRAHSITNIVQKTNAYSLALSGLTVPFILPFYVKAFRYERKEKQYKKEFSAAMHKLGNVTIDLDHLAQNLHQIETKGFRINIDWVIKDLETYGFKVNQHKLILSLFHQYYPTEELRLSFIDGMLDHDKELRVKYQDYFARYPGNRQKVVRKLLHEIESEKFVLRTPQKRQRLF